MTVDMDVLLLDSESAPTPGDVRKIAESAKPWLDRPAPPGMERGSPPAATNRSPGFAREQPAPAVPIRIQRGAAFSGRSV